MNCYYNKYSDTVSILIPEESFKHISEFLSHIRSSRSVKTKLFYKIIVHLEHGSDCLVETEVVDNVDKKD